MSSVVLHDASGAIDCCRAESRGSFSVVVLRSGFTTRHPEIRIRAVVESDRGLPRPDSISSDYHSIDNLQIRAKDRIQLIRPFEVFSFHWETKSPNCEALLIGL